MKKKTKKRRFIVEAVREATARGRGVTYQLERVLCGKPNCRKWHGPYWYAYWTLGNRTRTKYVGKVLRRITDAEIDEKTAASDSRRATLGNLRRAGPPVLPKNAGARRSSATVPKNAGARGRR